MLQILADSNHACKNCGVIGQATSLHKKIATNYLEDSEFHHVVSKKPILGGETRESGSHNGNRHRQCDFYDDARTLLSTAA